MRASEALDDIFEMFAAQDQFTEFGPKPSDRPPRLSTVTVFIDKMGKASCPGLSPHIPTSSTPSESRTQDFGPLLSIRFVQSYQQYPEFGWGTAKMLSANEKTSTP